MLPRNRRPTPPGEFLRSEFLEPLGLSQKELAQALGITRVRLSEIIHGKSHYSGYGLPFSTLF